MHLINSVRCNFKPSVVWPYSWVYDELWTIMRLQLTKSLAANHNLRFWENIYAKMGVSTNEAMKLELPKEADWWSLRSKTYCLITHRRLIWLTEELKRTPYLKITQNPWVEMEETQWMVMEKTGMSKLTYTNINWLFILIKWKYKRSNETYYSILQIKINLITINWTTLMASSNSITTLA